MKKFFCLSLVVFATIFFGCMSDGPTIVLHHHLSSSSSSTEHSSSSSLSSSSSSSSINSSSSTEHSSSSSLSSSSSSSSISSSSSMEHSSSSFSFNSSSSSVDLCAGFVDGTTREHYGKSKAQFCDSRDGKKYVYVTIGGQTWMAENLNYNATNSKCCGDNTGGDGEGNCAQYGRLYNWATAMNINVSCNTATVSNCGATVSSKHKGICPSGWHIPNDSEWTTLIELVGGSSTAGTKLKATSGWSGCGLGSSYSYQCEDAYGFSALPGGYGYSYGYFYNVGYFGYWWGATEGSALHTYNRSMLSDRGYVNSSYDDKSYFYSVRCVQD